MKIRNILSTIILVLILTLTVGFSAFVSEMSISNLVADIRVQKDIRITGIEMIDGNAISDSLEYTADTVFGTFSSSTEDTTLAKYKVTITNFGNVDVYFSNYYVEELSSGSFLCIEGCSEEIISGLGNSHEMIFEIENNEDMDSYFKIIVEFKEIFSVSFENINISDDIAIYDNIYTKYVGSQYKKKDFKVYMGGVLVSDDVWNVVDGELSVYGVYDNLVIERVEKVAKLVSGDLNTVGSEVCIKDECFYIINNDGTSVSVLAKYNLYVGSLHYVDMSEPVDPDFMVLPLENPTGLQNSKAIGWFNEATEENPAIGVSAFSNSDYWSDIVESYPEYVFNNESVLWTYVDNYETTLISYGANIINTRLIFRGDLDLLGCDYSDGFNLICNEDVEFLTSTTYWTGDAVSSGFLYTISSDADYLPTTHTDMWWYGVRPVIEMNIEDIYVPPVAKVVSGDFDTVGSEIAIGDEHFYVISSTDDSVTMLAKYNLLVGNIVDENYNVTPLSNTTGIQDSSARGILIDSEHNPIYPRIGTVAFSTTGTTYSGSIVEGYVNNYVSYLETLGVTINSSGLMSKEEILALSEGGSGDEFPEWLMLTSFWFDYAEKGQVYRFSSSGSLMADFPDCDDTYGVRPVITISKDNF